MSKTAPYAKRNWRNKTFDNRTVSALQWAEKKYLRRAPVARKHWVIAQGSYNAGGVRVSGGTHDGGGSVDISTNNMTEKQKRAAVKWLRKAGFAAWIRRAIPGTWGEHIHAVLQYHKTASPAAKAQCVSYRNKRDGLAGNAPDFSWRPKHNRRWSHRLGHPVILK